MAEYIPSLNGVSQPIFSHPIGEYRVFRVDPNDEYSSKFIHKVVIRALQFLEKYEIETDPVWVVNLIYSNFRARNNLLCICVAVDEKEIIKGHSIAYVDTNKDGAIAVILQMENETGDSRIVAKGMQITGEWARSLKLKYATATTISEAITRYDKRYGFKPWRTVMRLEL